MTATQTAETFKTVFATADCHRCDGKGYMNGYSHVAGGVCFACNGAKRKLTAAGAAAYEAYRAELVKANGVKAAELAVGDKVVSIANGRGIAQYGEAVRTIASIRNDDSKNWPAYYFQFKGEILKYLTANEDDTVLRFNPAAAREVAREIARRYPNGLTIVEG
ncbi:MAG: hypothetical protein ACRDRL_16770 [Sciscionella sp.]